MNAISVSEWIIIDDEDDTSDQLHQAPCRDTKEGILKSSQAVCAIAAKSSIAGSRSSSLTLDRRLPSDAECIFKSSDWSFNPASLGRQYSVGCSFGAPKFFASSPSSGSMSFSSNLGSSGKSIELDDIDDLRCMKDLPLESTRKRSIGQDSDADSVVIELDSWEDSNNATCRGFIPEGVEVICLEDIYSEDPKPKGNTKPTKQDPKQTFKTTKFGQRNPDIVAPFTYIETHAHNKFLLKPNKTVELKDEGFLLIKKIILNTETKEVKLRGHRLHRARHLNGLLEFKLNETVMFLEVDLDDPRDPLVQGAIEVPLDEVLKIRHAHFTNHKFPECRKMRLDHYKNSDEALNDGGLTTRWKYTCTYASASDRYQNVFRERTLERIKPDDCLPMNAVSDEIQRYQWRGETVRGGSYQPMVDGEDVHVLPTQEVFLRVENAGTGKRKMSDDLGGEDQWISKRVRYEVSGKVEDTRRHLSDVHLEAQPKKEAAIIDLTECPSDTEEPAQPSPSTLNTDFSILPKVFDLTNSDLSTPPPTVSIIYTPSSPPPPFHRTANQTYTYGDAFCGAGGSTRGAFLSGLRPKWGFDFSPHACASWRSNFPLGTCYNTEVHTFICRAPSYSPAFKIDILHLSPPCQFFSPAHTVNGVDDERNVASLFAVEEMIKVTTPRVVTLEQTFGIMCSRFRWYFNQLIGMFTSQNFSVRWAVVPLAQWGLPQRRNRLIIIASCPGEILPRMPLPTHSSSNTTLLPLVSADSTLLTIPSSPSVPDPLHNPLSPNLSFPPLRVFPPWDGSKILPRAMTTSGGQNYHPSGLRDLTLREYACLQGFPLEHVFKGNYVKKQIGNAVPPCVARVLFESIREDLERADGVVGGAEVIE